MTYIPATMPATSLTQPAVPEAGADAWGPGPLRPRLAEGVVHVWRADLAAVTDDLIELLSPEERARAERFLKARDGELWARAHGVLRLLVGRYLDAEPRRLRFAIGEHGKPALVDDSAGERARAGPATGTLRGLSFNLSHSEHVVLCAFTQIGPIGVDVEIARRPIDEVAVAARAFGPAVARRLEGLDGANRKREFLRAWTRHEAELKCRGIGIGGGAAGIAGSDMWIGKLDIGPQGTGAVAVKQAPRELCCWDLRV